MTILEQVNFLADALRPWAEEQRGRCYACGDQVEVMELLRTKPGGHLVAVLCDGEDPRGEWTELGKVDRVYKVIISRGKGFKIETGENLTGSPAGGKPLLDLVEEAREIVRALRVEATNGEDAVPVYKGMGPWEVSGFIMDAWEVRFSLAADIPDRRC